MQGDFDAKDEFEDDKLALITEDYPLVAMLDTECSPLSGAVAVLIAQDSSEGDLSTDVSEKD